MRPDVALLVTASTPWSPPPGAGEGEAAVPLDPATGRGRVPQGAREKPSYRWIRRPGGATCRQERGSSSSASAHGQCQCPWAVPLDTAIERRHAAESEGEAARINLNGFGAEPVRRSRE